MHKTPDSGRVVRPGCPCKECKAVAKRAGRRDARMTARALTRAGGED